jgi:hypothetical protein
MAGFHHRQCLISFLDGMNPGSHGTFIGQERAFIELSRVADVLSKARGDNALSDYPLAFPYRIADCCWEAVHFGRVPELPFINGTAGLEPSTYGEREPHHWIQRNAQSGM